MAMSSMFWTVLGFKTEVRVLMLGLDNAGKTTILNMLRLGEVVRTVPTIGLNIETVTFKNLTFKVWDIGGQDRIRTYWKSYYTTDTKAIIYVIDSTDIARLEKTRDALHQLLQEEELKDTLLCVFANKQDDASAKSEAEIIEALQLSKLKGRTWTIFKTSAIKNEGLKDGLEWLVEKISESS